MNTFVDEDAAWMQLALAQAHQAEAAGEVPVGAVVVKGGAFVGSRTQSFYFQLRSHRACRSGGLACCGTGCG